MKREQKLVAIGAGSGVVLMIGALIGLSAIMPSLPVTADTGDRLGFAAKWLALAAAPLFLAIIAVGNARFFSEAIDPTAGKETQAMIVNGRVVDNSLQQYVLFFAATMALAASANGTQLGLVSAASVIFVVCRLAFWVGYRIEPVYRAFGFASTAYLNIILFGTAIWLEWR
ncbi:MAG TPA: MAPEG family protein [Sphingomicrobium sp.]